MLAVADYAEGHGSQPQELTWAFQARAWGTLPNAGGLQDQSVGVLERMAAAENVYRAVKSWRGARDWARWSRENPEDWKLVQRVLTLREE